MLNCAKARYFFPQGVIYRFQNINGFIFVYIYTSSNVVENILNIIPLAFSQQIRVIFFPNERWLLSFISAECISSCWKEIESARSLLLNVNHTYHSFLYLLIPWKQIRTKLLTEVSLPLTRFHQRSVFLDLRTVLLNLKISRKYTF